MNSADLSFKTGQLTAKISRLQHGEQCETLNIMNSNPCDCGVKDLQLDALEFLYDVTGFLKDLDG